MRFLTATLGTLTLLAVAGCGSDDTDGSGSDLRLAISSGDGQSDTVHATLEPLTVTVTNSAGEPVEGIAVTWESLTPGEEGIEMAPATSTTDAAGTATSVATLGTRAAELSVTAAIPGRSVTFTSTVLPGAPHAVLIANGDDQRGPKGVVLAQPITARVLDRYVNPIAGATVQWHPVAGSGMPIASSSVTNATGQAATGWTLGSTVGTNRLWAVIGTADSIVFVATATGSFTLLGGGNNMQERYGSDLWVADGYGYTGSWGFRGTPGNAVKIWQLDGGGAPILKDSIITPAAGTISDIEVSPDGKWLAFTTETGGGLYVYEITAPGTTVFRASLAVPSNGLHTGTLAVIGGKLYLFGAKNQSSCALRIYDLSAAASGTITQASSTPIPDHYCIHDTFVRDGYAFVFAWDEGLYIFDVGNGSQGGTPQNPVQISHTVGFGGQTHNGWWFWNPNGEKRYLFIGEEGPGGVGFSSSGDIHVVDVSNLAAPVEVAFYHLNGAGVHNFWMDETRQILYAAYYNGGVVALDVSGTLTGNLANREIARFQPGGAGNTYAWGVMLYNNSLYVSDMVSGFWQLGVP